MANKEFDVIVYGATGFTGALVARYLLQEPESAPNALNAIKWAIAGRSAEKLQAVKDQLKLKVPSANETVIDAIPVMVADSSDEKQLVDMVLKTKVVLTVVGPYQLHGEPLVKVCAENGVHYCDLTGETLWVDRMMRKYDAVAKKSGAILINCCGFDSVPSDLTTLLLTEAVKKYKKSETSKVSIYFTDLDTGLSGGTLASAFANFDNSTSAELTRMGDPFHLVDEKNHEEKKVAGLIQANKSSLGISYEADLSRWSSFFFGGDVNAAVVHRSNFLKKGAYGDKFVYRERLAAGGLFKQIVMTVSVLIFNFLLYFSVTRNVVRRLVPKSGEGPSEEVMQNGKLVAKGVAYNDTGDLVARSTTIGTGDPFYSMTSKVIAETAMCLAKDEITNVDVKSGGFFTPAYSVGAHLAKRLHEKRIMTIDIQTV